ncbi:YgaP family membrane protein [Natronospora cellulosivora (SeqCode)]
MQNVGKIDRTIRIILGLIFFSFIFVVEGDNRFLLIIAGAIPFFTGMARYCPIYKKLGISTNKEENN